MIALNVTSYRFLASDVRVARSLFDRFRGLIGSRPLEHGEGLLIPHCKGVHTIGMRYSIDVIYLDREGKAIAFEKELAPNSIGHVYWQANAALELPSGIIDETRTKLGDNVLLGNDNQPLEPVMPHFVFGWL